MTVTWSWDLQAYISSSWVSIKRDVEIYKAPLVASRGIEGSDITSRVAAPGSLTCSLDNGESNSGGKLGYYSPDHANMRANFGRGTKVRLKITYDGTDNYKFLGTIADLEPSVGQFKERSSFLSAADYMQKLAERRLNLLAVQQDKRSDQIIDTVLDSMPAAPVNVSLDTDKFTLPFALSAEMDEKTTAMGAIQKVCQTVLGYFYIRGNTTDGETAVFQREESRAATANAATLDDTMSTMRVTRNTDKIKNHIVGKAHPVRVDDEDVLLYELESDIFVDGGDTQTFTFRFKDPNNLATRISALDVVTPLVANTHYRASKYENGAGADATALLTITDTNGGNSAEWQIENTGGYRVFINLIEIFGRGIYYFNPVEVVVESGDGDKSTTYDFYYLSDTHRAKQFLYRLHQRISATTTEVEGVTFYADESATLMDYAMDLDIGDRVTVQETATGLNGEYIINHVTYTIETNGTLRVDWKLEPADTHDYFILDSSLLDGADVLSPY